MATEEPVLLLEDLLPFFSGKMFLNQLSFNFSISLYSLEYIFFFGSNDRSGNVSGRRSALNVKILTC